MGRNGAGAISTAAILAVLLVSVTPAANWPRFRGPNGQGLSEAKTIPTQWSEEDYTWQVELPGTGHASPVVWGDRVFVTCFDETSGRGVALCLNAADGKQLWSRGRSLTKFRINSLNSLASATPAVDSEHVYILWPGVEETTVVALAHEGQPGWTATLTGVRVRHGYGSSLVVHGDHVIVVDEKEGRDSDIHSQWLALDCRTGAVAWRYEEGPVENASYSTPCVYTDKRGHEHLVFASNAHGIAAVNPATGDMLWELPSALPARVVGSPVIAGDLILGTCGEGGRGIRLSAVRPIAQGKTYSVTEVYGLRDKTVPYSPTLIACNDLLFAFHDSGLVSCLRPETGQVLWSEKPAGRFYGSPVCVNGVLYAIATDGDVVVLKADSTYTLLAVNPLGQGSQATPAVADGQMYLRTHSQLMCIGGKEH